MHKKVKLLVLSTILSTTVGISALSVNTYAKDFHNSNVNKNIIETNNFPTISAKDTTIALGNDFDPLVRVKAYDKEDGDISKDVYVVFNDVDVYTPGYYKVGYEVLDSQGEMGIYSIGVTVKERVPGNNFPTISAKDMTLVQGQKFDPLKGVTAHDKEDGDLTNDVYVVYNDVDINKPGYYKVCYEVLDSQGEMGIFSIGVTVTNR